MRAAITARGLSPSAFWALTPAELMLILGAGRGARPLGRARLDELAAQFPDVKGADDGGCDRD
ncbi:phage tail assembly chaperone [Rhodobacteraceae bacterium CCMM004]|nr:phage tail assembly chaperone [Rhodobacteraceae bacterium CCMM004]